MEFVLVLPRRSLFPEAYPQGFVPFGESIQAGGLEALVAEHGFFIERARAEGDPELKQVIPYAVVVRGGEVLLLRRLARGGEARLFNKLSIGVGGHVNPRDAEVDGGFAPLGSAARRGVIAAALRRELCEELAIEGDFHLEPLGLLNDDSNPVGAVHVGVVQRVTLEGDARVRERDVLEGSFVPPAELRRLHHGGENFETWSALLLSSGRILEPSGAAAPGALAPSQRHDL